ncbi:hypothetical protein KAS79_02925 [Candidatus Parcubacteria bacterium]|nr:hypothetical protein [Candidatus Parcubacteria bacterium]
MNKEKLEFLKRAEIRTMEKDIARFREEEAQKAREKLTTKEPVEIPAKTEEDKHVAIPRSETIASEEEKIKEEKQIAEEIEKKWLKEKAELEQKKAEAEERKKILENQKEPIETKKNDLLKQLEQLKQTLEPILIKEKEIEQRRKEIEEKERLTVSFEQKRKIEKQRWQVEDEIKETEKQRWQVEDEIEKIKQEIKKYILEEQKILKEKVLIKEKKDTLKKQLQEIEEKVEPLKLKLNEILEKEKELKQEIENVDKPAESPPARNASDAGGASIQASSPEQIPEPQPDADPPLAETPKPATQSPEDDEVVPPTGGEPEPQIKEPPKYEQPPEIKQIRATLEEVQKREEEERGRFLRKIEETDIEDEPAESPSIQESEPAKVVFRHLPQKPRLLEKIWIRFIILIVIFLILASIFTFWYWYFEIKSPQDSKSSTPEEIMESRVVIPPESLISVETIKIFEINSDEQTVDVFERAIKENLSKGFIRIIIKNQTENKILGLKEFFENFQIKAPENFEQKLNNDFTLFIYSSENNNFGFTAEITPAESPADNQADRENLKEIMLSWEETIKKDLEPLLFVLAENKDLTPSHAFKQASHKEADFRYISFLEEDLGICYSIFDNYFILTFSGDTIIKTIDNIKNK